VSVAREFLAGETLHALAKRYKLSRNLIRFWVQRFEACAKTQSLAQPGTAREFALTPPRGKTAPAEKAAGAAKGFKPAPPLPRAM
jgi:transposase